MYEQPPGDMKHYKDKFDEVIKKINTENPQTD